MNLPSALPDETLFSRYVRHLTILGIKHEDYLRILFNKSRISIHPYLTIGIAKASQFSNETPLEIFNKQTLGQLFAYFLPNQAKKIYQTLLGENGNLAIRACQLVTFKETDNLSLKYCPLCAKDNIITFGVSYWHRLHQVPGIEACSIHKVWLIHQALPERPHIKPNFFPPSNMIPQPCSDLSYDFSRHTDVYLNKITKGKVSFNLDGLLEKLRIQGFMRSDKRFNRKKLATSLYKFIYKLDRCPRNLLPYSECDYRYLSYLLSGQASQHPFKYLLVDFWLDSLAKEKEKSIKVKAHYESVFEKQITENLCIKLLKEKKSLAQISRCTGKSRCYLKTLAMKECIPIVTKPKKITNTIKEKVIAMSYQGFHRKVIAEKFSISLGSVEQIISSVPGLVTKRRRYKFESKRRRYKVQIIKKIKQTPLALKQEIKMACYSAFHWLYKHEKAWLDATLPLPTKPKVREKVDWKSRDLKLAPIVKEIMLNLNETISRTQLDKAVGGNGWLIREKHHFPVTMAIYYKLKKV